MLFFSPGERAFFDSEIHQELPADAREISAETHGALLAGQADGKVIAADLAGDPVLAEPPQQSPQQRLDAERARMCADRFQLRAALLLAGHLAAADAAASGADQMTQLAWADGTAFRRDSPALAVVIEALGLDEKQVDDLFRAAGQLQP